MVHLGQIHISSIETPVTYQGFSLVEKWRVMGKAQKAEMSQVALLVSHHKEANAALLVKCDVRGDIRSPPAKSQQRLCRIICWFQVHASHHLVLWQWGQPFSLSQRPVISGAKGSGAICCITYQAVRWETVWEKSSCYISWPAEKFQREFSDLLSNFFFFFWLAKRKLF